MLKHSDIIQKLDILQKVALVSSAFGGEPFVQAGVPPVKAANLGDLGKNFGISYASAIRSWNPALVEKMTGELVAKGAADGVKLFVTPDLKTAVNPYAEGLSEDPFLNGEAGAAILRAIKSAGAVSGLYHPSVGEKEIAFLDRTEDVLAVHDLILKPFISAVGDCPCDAVFCDPSREGKSYYSVNRMIFNEAQNGLFGDVMVVGDGNSPVPDAVSLLTGRVTLGGSEIPLERAARRFGQLKEYEAEGSISHREIEESVRDGSALDWDKLDEAVDAIIDFALSLDRLDLSPSSAAAEIPPAETTAEQNTDTAVEESTAEKVGVFPAENTLWREQAAEESIVLLKNDGVLPVAEGTKVAVLGDAYSDVEPFKNKYNVTGFAKGFDPSRSRSESFLPVALRTSLEADVVFVFLTADAAGRELALPPNRIALLDALQKGGKKVVGIVAGDVPVDTSFDRFVNGLLVAPADGRFSSRALVRVLCGEANPSGRLTRTSYDFADGYFRSLRADRDGGNLRVGAFTGYRRYVTENKKVRYPFGFGLSYTKFSYSDLKVSSDKAEFTLTNCGDRDGCEVVQLYTGVPSVSRLSPKKQLRGYLKVFLKAGESKKIALPLTDAQFSSYDSRLYADDVEEGEYTLFVGPSSQDTPLVGRISRGGVKRQNLGERRADYFPSDFIGDSAEVSSADRISRRVDGIPDKIKKARSAAIYALPAVALLFFLLVSTLILAYALDFILLSVADEATVEWSLYVIAVGVIAIIPLLGSLNRRRLVRIRTVALVTAPVLIIVCFVLGGILLAHTGGLAEEIALRIVTCLAVGVPVCAFVAFIIERQLRRTKTGKNRWDKYYFAREKEERTTSEAEFEEAFAVTEEERKKRAEAAAEDEEPPVREKVQFYDKQLTFVQLIRDLTKFLSERGLLVEEDSLKNYVAAVFSNRLVIVPAGGGAALCAAAAEYFGKKAYIDNAESYVRYVDMFMQWRNGGNASYPTNLSDALVSARRESAYLHTVIIRHVKKSALTALFTPFADVLSRRRETLPTTGGKTLRLPPNVLVVAELEEEDAYEIPAAIAEVAAVVAPVCGECEPSPRKTVLQSVGYERMEAMLRLARDYYPLDEELWKKVDALDDKCRSAHIGNRIWLKLETHSSVISACGDDASDALDGAMQAELLPWLSATWNPSDGALADVLRDVFGEDRLRRTVSVIKEVAE